MRQKKKNELYASAVASTDWTEVRRQVAALVSIQVS